MFFKKKVKLSQDEKIALVKQFISSDITLKQLAKDNHVKEKELMLWYQAYRYGIELSINNETKTDVIPLVSDDTALPEDTFIAFLNKDYSVNSKQFLPLLHSETDAIKFASGQGAVVAQGDETVLLDIREMVLSLCPVLTENDIIFAQIKDINISGQNTTKSVSDVSVSVLTWFVSGALEMDGLDIEGLTNSEIESSVHEHLYTFVILLENIGISDIRLLKGDVFGETILEQRKLNSDSIDESDIKDAIWDEALTFLIDINQDDWLALKEVSESVRSDLTIIGKYNGGIYQQMFTNGELEEGVLNDDDLDMSETYHQILSNLE